MPVSLTKLLLSINPFHVIGFFLYPLKPSENQGFSDDFKGVQKETSGMKWVNCPIKYCSVMINSCGFASQFIRESEKLKSSKTSADICVG